MGALGSGGRECCVGARAPCAGWQAASCACRAAYWLANTAPWCCWLSGAHICQTLEAGLSWWGLLRPPRQSPCTGIGGGDAIRAWQDRGGCPGGHSAGRGGRGTHWSLPVPWSLVGCHHRLSGLQGAPGSAARCTGAASRHKFGARPSCPGPGSVQLPRERLVEGLRLGEVACSVREADLGAGAALCAGRSAARRTTACEADIQKLAHCRDSASHPYAPLPRGRLELGEGPAALDLRLLAASG